MRTWVQHIWERIRTSFWFVPGLFTASALVLAFGMLALDRKWEVSLTAKFPGLAEISAAGTRELISTAATAMLSLAGITFSGVLVAMTLASNQFGPRLLRNFIRARSTQVTLGMLLSTFVYCLLILRGIRSEEGSEFVPHLASLAAFGGTLVSLGMFIFFIHHISTSLQADRVTETVFKELTAAIDRFFPKRSRDDLDEDEADEASDSWEELENEQALEAPRDGYVQALDLETLVETTADLDTRCRVLKRPGHFVVAGEDLLALPGDLEIDEETADKLRNCFLIGSIRTAEQDFEFAIRQLVEVALRALSPGINDPFTAINCIDFLGAALSDIGRRQLPAHLHRDGDGVPRALTRPVSFQSLLDSSFNQLRQVAGAKPDIVIRMLEAMGRIDRCPLEDSQRKALRHHAEMIFEAARRSDLGESDLEDIERRMALFRKKEEAR